MCKYACVCVWVRAGGRARAAVRAGGRARARVCVYLYTYESYEYVLVFVPSFNGNKGLADQSLLRAYTCVLQNKSCEGHTKGPRVTQVWSTKLATSGIWDFCVRVE